MESQQTFEAAQWQRYKEAQELARHASVRPLPCAGCAYNDKEFEKRGDDWQPNDKGFCTCQYSALNGLHEWYNEIPDPNKPRQCADFWQHATQDELTLVIYGEFWVGGQRVPFHGEVVFVRTFAAREYYAVRAHCIALADTDWRVGTAKLMAWVGLRVGDLPNTLGHEAQQVRKLIEENNWRFEWKKP